MTTHPASVHGLWTWLRMQHKRKPLPVLLSVMLLLSSVSIASGAKPEDPGKAFDEMIARGPHETLELNPAGHIVPRPQRGAAANELAKGAARSLNEGLTRGYWEVAADFTVTLTAEGQEAAEKMASGVTNQCQSVTSITADWTGFKVELESTCTEQEQLDYIKSLGVEPTAGIAPQVSAAGLAPIAEQEPSLNAGPVISEDWQCVISIGATLGAFTSAAWLMLVPWAGWIWFTVMWSGWSAGFLSLVTTTINNCTQVMEVSVSRDVWVSYEPLALPIGAVGLGSLRITDVIAPEEERNEYWVKQKRYCRFQYYSSYRWSRYGYSVPLYVRHTGC
jgi:hypothetical protein